MREHIKEKRTGVYVALQSLQSEGILGNGNIGSLYSLIDRIKEWGGNTIQILPLNDLKATYSPYDSYSAYAIDPMYIDFMRISGIPKFQIKKKYNEIQKQLEQSAVEGRVNYEAKKRVLIGLKGFFLKYAQALMSREYNEFCVDQKHWLDNYCLFKLGKELFCDVPWWEWPQEWQECKKGALREEASKFQWNIKFHQWLQYELDKQLREVAKYAREQGVYLIGDMPFLVSKDSADCWSMGKYFDLTKEVGVPPDELSKLGQRWGLPAYNWEGHQKDDYRYFRKKAEYLSRYFNAIRIDHVLGCFRLWIIDQEADSEEQGIPGEYKPQEESVALEQGQEFLENLKKITKLDWIGENLGFPLEGVDNLLRKYNMAGISIVRWDRDWDREGDFLYKIKLYPNNVLGLSTHDTSTGAYWFKYECGGILREEVVEVLEREGIDIEGTLKKIFHEFSLDREYLQLKSHIESIDIFLWELGVDQKNIVELRDKCIKALNENKKMAELLECSLSSFLSEDRFSRYYGKLLKEVHQAAGDYHIEALSDYLVLSGDKRYLEKWARLNIPGTISNTNWSMQYPKEVLSVESSEVYGNKMKEIWE